MWNPQFSRPLCHTHPPPCFLLYVCVKPEFQAHPCPSPPGLGRSISPHSPELQLTPGGWALTRGACPRAWGETGHPPLRRASVAWLCLRKGSACPGQAPRRAPGSRLWEGPLHRKRPPSGWLLPLASCEGGHWEVEETLLPPQRGSSRGGPVTGHRRAPHHKWGISGTSRLSVHLVQEQTCPPLQGWIIGPGL